MDPRALLLDDRRQTGERLARLRADVDGVMAASRDTNADDEHDPEGQTIAYERSQTLSLLRQAEAHLEEIGAALERYETARFGVCERCGEQIARARLEARPTARRCVTCATMG